MPCWYYDKTELRHTPSIRDGITLETERRYRREGARFIMSCGTNMGLGHNTLATGIVYFHRFYMFHSFKSFPRYVTACCCLLLAGKVEETPKKCWDIINIARQLLTDNYFYSFGKEPKEEVVTLERILLQTIKFDLQVEHPYTFLLKYAKCLKGDQQKLQKMVQMAWNFVNDSLSTVLCLQWEPEIIAVALIHLASKLSKFTVSDWKGKQSNQTRWWDMFVQDMTMEILEDICHQVLDLYQNNPKESAENNSPPQKPPSRIENLPSTSRMCGVNIPPNYKRESMAGGVFTSNNNYNNKPSTSANATAILYGPENVMAVQGNNNAHGRKIPAPPLPLMTPAPPSYPCSSKDMASSHYSKSHRSASMAAGIGSGQHNVTHLQSLYNQVALQPPPPPPPPNKYSRMQVSSTPSSGRSMSPKALGPMPPNVAQPPLPPHPAPPYPAPTNYYRHPHFSNIQPPIPIATLPKLPPPPPPPPMKHGMPTANPPSSSSSHHKHIPLPSGGYPSDSRSSNSSNIASSSSSSSSRKRH